MKRVELIQKLTALAMLLAVGGAAIAQPASQPFLRDYESPGTIIRAGFVPTDAQPVFGEPLQAVFAVENIGPTNFEFWFGGDYRGTGRHDRFKITATNASGEALPDPLAHPMDFGGMTQQVRLDPGHSFTNVVTLTDFRVFGKAGVYTVNCRFAFDERGAKKEQTKPTVNTSFTLAILERTPERVTKVLDRLANKALVAHGSELGETLGLMARFGNEAAVPHLAQFAQNGPVELRSAALGTLPLIQTDATFEIVLAALKDSDPAIQSAAAGSLGTMQEPRAVEALLDAFSKEKSPVGEAILLALGTTKSDRAFPIITNALEVGEVGMQRAAINALVNFGGSNAMAVLQQHINTNCLSLRYEIVLALAEKLRQPMQAEWLLPILSAREQSGAWLDSLRLLRLYGGEKAIPTMLSCVDFDVPWSERNWWILEQGVKPCPNAPPIDYKHDPNSDGTPEQWQKNARLLTALKPLAGPIPAFTARSQHPFVPYLKTDPPIDFTPAFRDLEDGGVEIKSGFLSLTIRRGGASLPYTVSEFYRPIYEHAAHFRSLANIPAETRTNLGITSGQMQRLTDLLHQFAVKLCGPRISDQKIGNLYRALVFNSNYSPSDDDWTALLFAYKEAPAGPTREQAKSDLIDSVRVFSQNYHAGTVEFVESAGKIFTLAQLVQILR